MPANLIRATYFLWDAIRFRICGKIDKGSLIMPTCSAEVDWDILCPAREIGKVCSSTGGMCCECLLTNANSLVLSGTKMVLDFLGILITQLGKH